MREECCTASKEGGSHGAKGMPRKLATCKKQADEELRPCEAEATRPRRQQDAQLKQCEAKRCKRRQPYKAFHYNTHKERVSI